MKEDLLRKRGWSLASEGTATTHESVAERAMDRFQASHEHESNNDNDQMDVENQNDVGACKQKASKDATKSGNDVQVSTNGEDAASNKRRRIDFNFSSTASDNDKIDKSFSKQHDEDNNSENLFANSDDGDEDITAEKLIPRTSSSDQKNSIAADGSISRSNDGDNKGHGFATISKPKFQLSKLAARLFDPNRPRGVIEAPAIIPQNDEFLKEFGIREKDAKSSITGQHRDFDDNDFEGKESSTMLIHIERRAQNQRDDKSRPTMEDLNKGDKEKDKKDANENPSEGSKVKINNLKYTTKEETIRGLMDLYGTITEFKLIMDMKSSEGIRNGLSIGKAYCTFSTPDEANDCVKALQEYKLDGRPLRLQVVPNDPRKERAAHHGGVAGALMMGGGMGGVSLLSRYGDRSEFSEEGDSEDENDRGGDRNVSVSRTNSSFVTDLRLLAMKCRRCGQIGHAEASCSNQLQEKPCVLCAKVGHVGPKDCPAACVCFNCGVPGHAARDCPDVGSINSNVKRMVCGMCFASGHHRWQCPVQNPMQIEASISEALCMDCGSKGHFSCVASRWKYNVTQRQSATGGFSCFNCGEFGHHGASCARPKVDVCARNPQIVQNELQRAGSWVDQIERHYMSLESNRRENSRNRDRRNSGSGNRRNSNNGSGNRRNSNNGSGSRRDGKGNNKTNYDDEGRGRSSQRHGESRSGYRGVSHRQRSRTQPPPTSRRY